MKVYLHIGAHRTGGAVFYDYLAEHGALLHAHGIDVCGPDEVRGGLFAGVTPCQTARALPTGKPLARTRVSARLELAKAANVKAFICGTPTMLGDLTDLAGQGGLYPRAGRRVARYAAAFPNGVDHIVLSIRSLESFWVSALAQAVSKGAPVPERAELRALALSPRSWRDVICEIADAVPHAAISVFPFERFRGRPDAFLEAAFDVQAPAAPTRRQLNRAPHLPALRRILAERREPPTRLPFGMGLWNPFCAEELAALRETYADDMMWLVGGAGGLATLTEDRPEKRARKSVPFRANLRGQSNAIQERYMARPG